MLCKEYHLLLYLQLTNLYVNSKQKLSIFVSLRDRTIIRASTEPNLSLLTMLKSELNQTIISTTYLKNVYIVLHTYAEFSGLNLANHYIVI